QVSRPAPSRVTMLGEPSAAATSPWASPGRISFCTVPSVISRSAVEASCWRCWAAVVQPAAAPAMQTTASTCLMDRVALISCGLPVGEDYHAGRGGAVERGSIGTADPHHAVLRATRGLDGASEAPRTGLRRRSRRPSADDTEESGAPGSGPSADLYCRHDR